MRDSVLLLSASPHKNGTTSRISALIEDGCRRAGFRTAVLDFSGMNFLGCTHCGTCSQRLRYCPLEGKDDCSETFATIIGSRYLVIVSPIYNYGLPAQFKALVDRTQYFYSSGIKPRIAPRAAVLLLAGRTKGEKLFEGARLTLHCFFHTMGIERVALKTLRGLESPQDLSDELRLELRKWGAGLFTPGQTVVTAGPARSTAGLVPRS